MKTLLIFVVTLLACSALFFFAHHHHRKPDSFKDCTLAEIYSGLFREVPPILSAKMLGFYSVAFLGIVAAFYPAILVLMTRVWTSNAAEGDGPIFVLAGVLALAGVGANLFVMFFSHLNFSFGISNAKSEATLFFFVLPIVQLAFALFSVAMGFSTTCVTWAHRIVCD